MKIKFLIAAVWWTATSLGAPPQDFSRKVQEEAETYAKALIMHDHAAMLEFTHERVITRMGGKDTALELLRKSAEEMKAKGLGVDEALVGVPDPPRKVGDWLVSVVPETLTLKTPTAKAQQESFLLAISADEGKTWKFVDLGPLSEEKLFGLFPELKDRFRMPPKKQPIIEKKP